MSNQPYCAAASQRGTQQRIVEKPPVFGYNYESITLCEGSVTDPGIAFPTGVSRPTNGLFIPSVPVVIVGLWLASSIVNPNSADVGVFVGKVSGEATRSMSKAPGIYFQHLSKSDNTISRTGGLAFGEQSGLHLGGQESFGVYLSGNDAGIVISYALTITYITSFTA